MKPKPPRFRYVDVLSTTITHRCFDELRRRAYNNKVSTSKLSKSIISEYLKDIEKIASLLEIKKINEPKRNILINSVDPIISAKIMITCFTLVITLQHGINDSILYINF